MTQIGQRGLKINYLFFFFHNTPSPSPFHAGIRLKCKGEAQVYFTDRSAGIRRKFSAFENYLHVETYVVGGK